MVLAGHMTLGDGTLQITSNITLFETCCRIWHSVLNFVGDVQGIHFCAGKCLLVSFTSMCGTTLDEQLYHRLDFHSFLF